MLCGKKKKVVGGDEDCCDKTLKQLQAVWFYVLICISLIVFIIQMATDPAPEPGPSGGLADNYTGIHSCRHFINVNNVTYPMECGFLILVFIDMVHCDIGQHQKLLV